MYTRDGMLFGSNGDLHWVFVLFCFSVEFSWTARHGGVMGGTHGARASDMGRDGRALRFWLQQKLRGFGLVLGVVSFVLGERGVRLPCARCTLAGGWEGGGAAEGGRRLAEVMRRSKYIGGHIETFEGFKRQDFSATYLCMCLGLLGLGCAGVLLG